MILADQAINWIWYYDTEKMVCFRRHRGDANHPTPDGHIRSWTDKEGWSGWNSKTDSPYPSTHVHLSTGEVLELNASDFKTIE